MLAYFNGDWIPYADVRVPVWDYGFTMGVAVSEQLRTFGGRLHCLEQHLRRLKKGLALTGIEAGLTTEEIGAISVAVAERNYALLAKGQDLGLGICITPGCQAVRAPVDFDSLPQATVLVSANPLPFRTWCRQYETGIDLSTVDVREIPNECLPTALKCRSRMHYFIADREADQLQPGSRALMLDMQGYVAEAPTASLAMVSENRIVAPPEKQVLPGISFRYVQEQLAPALSIEVERRPIALEEMQAADEVLWLSTSPCVLPVSSIDGVPIGTAANRPVFEKLIRLWSERVGVDIIGQAQTA